MVQITVRRVIVLSSVLILVVLLENFLHVLQLHGVLRIHVRRPAEGLHRQQFLLAQEPVPVLTPAEVQEAAGIFFTSPKKAPPPPVKLDVGDGNTAHTQVPIITATLSTVASTYPAKRCIDNAGETFCHSADPDTDPWLLLDLGSSIPIASVVLYNRRDCCGDRIAPFNVYVDNTPDTRLHDTLRCAKGTSTDPVIVIPCNATGRYVRLVLLGIRTLHLLEVQVYRAAPAERVAPPRDGPPVNFSREIGRYELKRYWRPRANYHPPATGRYLSFEPWRGGFNNRRMSLELAFVLAYLFNRTLVLPPVAPLANLRGSKAGFEDFFDIFDMRRLIPVMTYVDYRKVRPMDNASIVNLWPVVIDIKLDREEVLGGYLFVTANDLPGRDPATWELSIASEKGEFTVVHTVSRYDTPDDRLTPTTVWSLGDGYKGLRARRIKWVIRDQRQVYSGRPDKGNSVCQIGELRLLNEKNHSVDLSDANVRYVGTSPPGEDASRLIDGDIGTKFMTYEGACGESVHPQAHAYCKAFLTERNGGNNTVAIKDFDFVLSAFAHPTLPTAETPPDRIGDLKAFLAERDAYPIGDLDRQNATVVHFPQVLFMNWYTSIWFQRKEVAKEINRAVRDHIHFNTGILERASRIAAYLGPFTAVHVRRTDFKTQYKKYFIEPDVVVKHTLAHLHTNETVYVASDEREEEFYTHIRAEFAKHGHTARHLADTLHIFKDQYLPVYWHGCIEQMVCAHARVFIGTRASTFSSYISRLRGYRGQSNQEVYFTDMDYHVPNPKIKRDSPYGWQRVWKGAIWAREYPEGWAD